jgi:molybdenum cofactor biosynthesis protein B
MSKKPKGPFLPLNVAILTVSNSRTLETDTSGALIAERVTAAGHRVVERVVLEHDLERLRAQFRDWVEDARVDAIVSSGGTGLTRQDVAPEALAPFVTKPIPGFGELFRALSFQEIGSSAIESRAFAAIAGATLVFCLPGSTGACRTALDKLILPQLDSTTTPCNLAEMLPRARHG